MPYERYNLHNPPQIDNYDIDQVKALYKKHGAKMNILLHHYDIAFHWCVEKRNKASTLINPYIEIRMAMKEKIESAFLGTEYEHSTQDIISLVTGSNELRQKKYTQNLFVLLVVLRVPKSTEFSRMLYDSNHASMGQTKPVVFSGAFRGTLQAHPAMIKLQSKLINSLASPGRQRYLIAEHAEDAVT